MAAQAAAVHQHQQHHQKQLDDLNRAVMFQRLQQAARPQGPPMGMVSSTVLSTNFAHNHPHRLRYKFILFFVI